MCQKGEHDEDELETRGYSFDHDSMYEFRGKHVRIFEHDRDYEEI